MRIHLDDSQLYTLLFGHNLVEETDRGDFNSEEDYIKYLTRSRYRTTNNSRIANYEITKTQQNNKRIYHTIKEENCRIDSAALEPQKKLLHIPNDRIKEKMKEISYHRKLRDRKGHGNVT